MSAGWKILNGHIVKNVMIESDFHKLPKQYESIPKDRSSADAKSRGQSRDEELPQEEDPSRREVPQEPNSRRRFNPPDGGGDDGSDGYGGSGEGRGRASSPPS